MQLKLKPSLEEVQEIVKSGKGNTIPIYAELHADMLTPVSAYLKVSDRSQYSFLLESVAGGETIGRYSFIGSGNWITEAVYAVCSRFRYVLLAMTHIIIPR